MKSITRKIVLMRHGESQFNFQNKLAGWLDVRLTPKGIQEVVEAAHKIKQQKITFDVAYTSFLSRSIISFNLLAQQLNCHYIPVYKSWRLNERHYGALQGRIKTQLIKQYGTEQVKAWRRGYETVPPPLNQANLMQTVNGDRRYNEVRHQLPLSQSLKMTVDRVGPIWKEQISRDLQQGKRVLIVSHGNTIRALLVHIEGLDGKQIGQIGIPEGVPLQIEMQNKSLNIIGKRYLIDDEQELIRRQQSNISPLK